MIEAFIHDNYKNDRRDSRLADSFKSVGMGTGN